jgi:proteasome lid subunit RPN8/RPN11
VVISERHITKMVDHARSEFPNEACGLLASSNGTVVRFYPIRNAEASPVTYRMEPHDQLTAMLDIDDQGWDLGAIYHSHTRTRAYPSPTDVSLAFYPDALYVIVSLANTASPDVRAYRILNGAVTEEPLERMP